MNPGAKLGLNQAAPTAAAKQAAKDSEPPTRGHRKLNWAKVEARETLYEKWIELLKELKKCKQLPEVTLGDVLSFYRYHVDEDVFVDPFVAKERIFAYRINDRFGWIQFYVVSGLVIEFEWFGKTIEVNFDHLARAEVVE